MASLTLSWIQLVAAVGAVQGVLLSGVLLARRNNRTANRLLATLMATFTIYLASGVYYESGLFRAYPHFFGVGYQTPWVFGPLVYLYARAASDRSWTFGRREWLHFLPVAISIAAAAEFYLLGGAEKVALFDRWVAEGMPAPLAWIDPFKYVSGLGYSIATVLLLRRHRRQVELSYSNTSHRTLTWLLWLTASAFGIWILATLLRVLDVAAVLRDEPISLSMAVLVYAIGYLGLRQPEVFRYETAEYPVVGRVAIEPAGSREIVSTSAGQGDAGNVRYERSGLAEAEARAIKASLLAMMESESPWKDSDLTLADLAGRLDTSPHKLSEVLNAEMGQTFYDFVNGYRVRDVQRRIAAGESERRKMLALAMDAGFASKSTFNQAFKRHTNQTPSDFRATVAVAASGRDLARGALAE